MRLTLYCLASLALDFTFYVLWTVLPFYALKLGADSFQVGMLPMITGTVYIVLSITSGWLSDRFNHAFLMRLGLAVAAMGMLLVGLAHRLEMLFLAAPITSVGTGLFWPTVQNAISKEHDPLELNRAVGWFNFSWALGKALGFLAGGLLLEKYGPLRTLQVAASITAAAIFCIPANRFWPKETSLDSGERIEKRPSGFLRASWLGNFAAFGVSIIINVHYPKFLLQNLPAGSAEKTFGIFMCIVFAAQTLCFMLLLTSSFWTYRWTPILLLMAFLGAATVALPQLHGFAGMTLAALPIGAGLGMAYSASIYYSLHGPRLQGLKAGIHEAIIGSAGVIFPPAGGWLAERYGDLRWPFWVASAAVALALAYQTLLASRRER